MPEHTPEQIAFLKSALKALTNLSTLPLGQAITVTHPWAEFEQGWITNARPSLINGHTWRYGIRSDKKLRSGYSWLGEQWFDEDDIQLRSYEMLPSFFKKYLPSVWPPQSVIGRRPGIWGSNGNNPNLDLMLSWPGAITCIYDYLSSNGVDFARQHPEMPLIIRFLHPQNWQENPAQSASDLAQQVISKWPTIRDLNPYVYFANELNLGYESGRPDIPALDTENFYQRCGLWITDVAKQIKNAIPEIRLVTPPWAFGHNEDGEPVDGIPKIGWAGYDYLQEAVKDYFDNILTFHAYWPHGTDELYDPELSSWYAFRWRRVLELFKVRYGLDCRMIIDEAGNMDPARPDFFDQVKYFSEECLSDGRVIAVTYFLWADPTGHNNINSWVDKIPDLENFCQRLAALPDVQIATPGEPEPDPGPEPTPEPEPEPSPEPSQPEMVAEYTPGSAVIRGDLGEAGIELTLTFWGNKALARSGHKSEIGGKQVKGGFEFVTYGDGDYGLEWGGYAYTVKVRGQNTITLSFGDGGETKLVELRTVKPIPKKLADEIIAAFPGIFVVI